MAERIYSGDTAVLNSALLQNDGVNLVPVNNVEITALSPDGRDLLVNALPLLPEEGDRVGLTTGVIPFAQWDIIEWDGLAWNDIGDIIPWNIEDNTAAFAFPGQLTQWPGLYQVRVKFTTTQSLTKSERIWFEAVDALQRPATTSAGIVVDRAWMKLEDLFDSELGGPYLRDRTLSNFDKSKMAMLLPDALYSIGATYSPVVVYTEDNFPFTEHASLAGQSLLVETIRHLMRSYVEQPLPVGSNVTYFDRRDYLQRWQTILQLENEKLLLWIDLFKQGQLGFGQAAMLIGGYNSPGYRIPRYMRGRYPYTVRF